MSIQNKYLTTGVLREIPLALQLLFWELRERVPSPDYLQVYRLSEQAGFQRVLHEQEQPPHRKEYLLNLSPAITTTVYIIDDGDHATMLLASEY